MQPLSDLTLGGYLEALASDAPAPGGGAVAAITGAQAAALLSMVVRISASEEPRESVLAPIDELRNKLLRLATEDGVVFAKVLDAYKLPSVTENDKKARKLAVQDCLRRAAEIPLEVLRQLAALHDLADAAVASAKASVVSDAAIAVHLMGVAMRSTTLNVEINLAYIKDKDFCERMADAVAELRRGRKRHRKELLTKIKDLMPQ